MPRHILFDLDGTLIDSAPAILQGFARVLAEDGVAQRLPLDRELIGPPLRSTLARLGGVDDPLRLDSLVQRFTSWYDSEGYRGSTVYAGVPAMLQALRARGLTLHIVTNKRLRPTLLILDWLGWRDWFQRVDTQDLRSGAPLSSKAQVLARLLEEEQIPVEDAVYVGDRADDVHAAAQQRLHCLVVGWGYGAADTLPAGTEVISTPDDLGARLVRP